MNRKHLQDIARLRLKEAKVLLDNGHYDGAYYLCGYAIECALKACIAKKTNKYDFPDKKTVLDSYTHDFKKLAQVAEISSFIAQESNSDPLFAANWAIVVQWSEESRYQRWTEAEARSIYNAVAKRNHGVLQWIKQFW
ncbi:HEPN domain-containing protein [Argonema antarcticum]|uniref:HEPN domain-containing protein n=1 Tax=Argonema antarcticum TaxID=2942763 RepID=UPI0020127BA2|nr:HEPN domain-containing protein [Argonema antarcticum A004/B2]